MKLRDSFAVAVLAAACLAAPASAQLSNNSNITGTNNSNSSIPGQGFSGSAGSAGYSSNVLSQAQSLQQQLAAAQNALNSFTPLPDARSGPRYFARGSQECNCTKPGDGGAQERAQLEANLAKAQADAAAFLASVKNPGSDKLGDVQAGAKVGHTW
jgi:hypothetical protein